MCVWVGIGHSSFLGFLYLDYVYNNAVIHVFVSILVNRSTFTTNDSLSTNTPGGNSESPKPWFTICR